MPTTIDIDVPQSVSARSIWTNLAHLRWDVPDNSHVRLRFGDRWQHVAPWYLAATAAWAASARDRGCTFEVINGDLKPAAYMWRMHLHDFLGIEPSNVPVEHEETGRFVALRTVSNHDEMVAASEDILPLVKGAGREDWLGALKHIYSELLRNVLEHAGASRGAVICAQWYPKSGYVQVAVADAGRGIRASLSETHAVESDKEAILLAMRPGVTGTAPNPYGGQRNAGVGLAMTRQLAEASHRYFAIASGAAAFLSYKGDKAKPDDATRTRPISPFPGTVVCAELHLAEEVESDDAIQAARRAITPTTDGDDLDDRILFE